MRRGGRRLTTMVLLTQLLLVLLCSAMGHPALVSNDLLTPTAKQRVICLLEDRFNEILLECGVEGVINVVDHQFGSQEVTQDSPNCVYQKNDSCAKKDTNMMAQLYNKCMGRSQCLVPIETVSLNDCGQGSNYLQVAYECVPDNRKNKFNIVDVCGDMMGGSYISRETGYIESPDYPEVYPPDVSCSCNLTTTAPDAILYLNVVDINLESPYPGSCQWDWLEYTVEGQHWGQGKRLCRPHGSDVISTMTNTLQLNFKTDGRDEQRGFWIQYAGRKSNGEFTEVRVVCGQYTPSIVKSASVCQPHPENTTTVTLNCTDIGVINILSTQDGHVQGDLQKCDQSLVTECSKEAANKDTVIRHCMGASNCTLNVSMSPLPQCKKVSNFYDVNYQCIPNVYDPSFVLDICGRTTPHNSASRLNGFIESVNYPANYLPDTSCYCRLTTSPQASIMIKLLDIELHGHQPGGQCGEDWLEFRNPGQSWDSGRRLCDQTLGSWIHTANNEIFIDFYSNGRMEARGFWLEYSGLRNDGTEVPVRVTCDRFFGVRTTERNDVTDSDLTPKKTRDEDNRARRIGLIAGLCTVATICVLVIVLLFILRFRSPALAISPLATSKVPSDSIRSHDKLSEPTMTVAEPSTPLDKNGSTHKHYSSVLDSGSYLPPVGDTGLYQSERHLAHIQDNPPSYLNPAFDGSEGIHPTQANPTV